MSCSMHAFLFCTVALKSTSPSVHCEMLLFPIALVFCYGVIAYFLKAQIVEVGIQFAASDLAFKGKVQGNFILFSLRQHQCVC